MASEKKFLVWCITKEGKEILMGNGEPMIEKHADNFARSMRGGIGTQVGNHYVVRPLTK